MDVSFTYTLPNPSPGRLYQFALPLGVSRSAYFPHSCQHIMLSNFLIFVNLLDRKWYLLALEVGRVFVWLRVTYISFPGNCLFISFAYLLIGLFSFSSQCVGAHKITKLSALFDSTWHICNIRVFWLSWCHFFQVGLEVTWCGHWYQSFQFWLSSLRKPCFNASCHSLRLHLKKIIHLKKLLGLFFIPELACDVCEVGI